MLSTGKDGIYYYLDLDKINDWIFINKNDEPISEVVSQINLDPEATEGDESYIHSATEVDFNAQYSNIRYELIHNMLNNVYMNSVKSEENSGFEYIQDIEELSVATKIILNTLMDKKFLLNKM